MASELKQRLPSSKIKQPTNLSNDPILPPGPPLQPTMAQRALASTAHLANLLPTGTLLAFQLLTPIFTNSGQCDTATRAMTGLLLALLGISCFLASFTDSFRASDDRVYYGLATFKGMWLFDYPGQVGPDLTKYKLRFVDWIHACLSMIVFWVVALRDRNVVNCFYPRPSHEVQQVLDIVPVGVGLICSLLFVAFPTTRHGIGYPVSNAH